MLHELAHAVAGGRWVATGGGGYQWAQRRAASVDARVRRDGGRAADLPDELPADGVERAGAFASASAVPATFSEPSLGAGARGRRRSRRAVAAEVLRHSVGLMARDEARLHARPGERDAEVRARTGAAGASVFRIELLPRHAGGPCAHGRADPGGRGKRPGAAGRAWPTCRGRRCGSARSPGPVHLQARAAFELRPDGDGETGAPRPPIRGSRTTCGGRSDPVGRRRGGAHGRPTSTGDRRQDALHAQAVRVRSGQGVNVPAERLSLPAVTERDREGLARALDLGRRPGRAVVRARRPRI